MNTTRWPAGNVWNQLQDLHHEMNRLFSRWGEDGGRGRASLASYPAVNVWEAADAAFVEAELPGLKLEDLEIYVTAGNQLTLKGERKAVREDKGVWHRQERGFGSFSRALTLPFPVDADRVEARFEHGVLTIRLPKHESARPRKISITNGQ